MSIFKSFSAEIAELTKTAANSPFGTPGATKAMTSVGAPSGGRPVPGMGKATGRGATKLKLPISMGNTGTGTGASKTSLAPARQSGASWKAPAPGAVNPNIAKGKAGFKKLRLSKQ